MKPALSTALFAAAFAAPLVALASLGASPAAAQTYSTSSSHAWSGAYGSSDGRGGSHPRAGERYRAGYGHDFNGQADVPGDYRCDAYWDRGRTDCDARWRDQRPSWRRTTYRSGRHDSHGYDHGYTQARAAVYPGAYGRPDVVHSGGHDDGWRGSGRDPQRIGWCSAAYRSYEPSTGYYIAYSGRPVFCG